MMSFTYIDLVICGIIVYFFAVVKRIVPAFQQNPKNFQLNGLSSLTFR